MMKQTATLQANLDYIHSQDAMEKLRTAMGIAPVMIGLFANSPLLEGRFTGTLSLRAEAWRYTDPGRCGLIREVFEDPPCIESFLEYLLRIPMIFIVRNEKWIPVCGQTFGNFLDHGYLDFKPTVADWELFLTSIFTEARLNPFVELRSSDRNALDLSFGMLAFWKGLLLDSEARSAVWDLVRDWKFEERTQFCAAAAYRALRARLKTHTIKDLGIELMNYAQGGLKKRWTQGLAHEDESNYLEPVKQLLAEGLSPAEKLVNLWEGSWNRDPKKLIEYSRI
jgi:glutamate--cysteine ligase